jgi:hypothetical protein
MVNKQLKQIINQNGWYRMRNEMVVKAYRDGKRIEDIAYTHNLTVTHAIKIVRAFSTYRKEYVGGYGNS